MLYPTSLERQKEDLGLCVKLFDDKNVAALKYNQSQQNVNNEGTISFLETIIKWWKVVNVSHTFKGARFNDTFFQPIRSLEDETFLFLKKFGLWIKKWNEIQVQGENTGNSRKQNGKLTLDTQQALEHSVFTVLQIVEYLKTVWNFDYILFGKFQTDPLEARFGQYRQMSGGCYHVSVMQILESEKKLKIVSVIKLFSASQKEIKISELPYVLQMSLNPQQQQSTKLCYETSEFEDISCIEVSDNDLACLTLVDTCVTNYYKQINVKFVKRF